MEEEFALTGKLEEGTRLEISFEETGIVYRNSFTRNRSRCYGITNG